jgi:light-regulated signal transduction histidine kinase (bacteriophytochrome)
LLQKQVDENGAIVEIGELPILYAYRSSIMQVFQNLVGNSIKYVHKGVIPHIKIAAEEIPGYWQFSVADNGIGIEPEYFGKIFIIFQRLHNQHEFSGTGIGLAISKKIIENLGGSIWLESEPGKGTTFYFTIKK